MSTSIAAKQRLRQNHCVGSTPPFSSHKCLPATTKTSIVDPSNERNVAVAYVVFRVTIEGFVPPRQTGTNKVHNIDSGLPFDLSSSGLPSADEYDLGYINTSVASLPSPTDTCADPFCIECIAYGTCSFLPNNNDQTSNNNCNIRIILVLRQW